MIGVTTFMPFVVVALALIAAASVAVVAWHLSSDDFHKSFESDSHNDNDSPD